ncbi:MAG: GMC family oxidoreductase [Gemmatimonadota bacterium]|nr:GMC family oxidoreductase [Gemmatimonadota bacterium]
MRERPTPSLRPAERGLAVVLRWLGVLLLGAAIFYFLAPLVGPWRSGFRPVVWMAASAAKVSLLGALCLYASADPLRHRSLVTQVAVAHVFSVTAMLVLMFFGDVDGTLPGTAIGIRTMLWIAIAMDTVIIVTLFVLRSRIRNETDRGIYALDDHEPVTAAEGNLRAYAVVFGVAFMAGGGALVWLAWRGDWPDLLGVAPWVTNGATLLFSVGLIQWFASKDIRQRQSVLGVVCHAIGAGFFASIGYWAIGPDRSDPVRLGGVELTTADVWLIAAAFFAAAYTALFLLYQAAWRERYGLRYLEPMEFRTLLALADVLIEGEEEVVSPLAVAGRVDETIFKIGARRRWVYRMILFGVYMHPLAKGRPPLPEIAYAPRREHLIRHFYRGPLEGRLIKVLRDLVSGAIRAAKQLAYVGYYSHEEAWDVVGYTPFSKRPPQPGEGPRDVSPTTLDVWGVTHPETRVDRLRADVCIVGSGAGGATIARGLAEREPGLRILVVERGRYVPPSAFTENEIDMMAALYADGLFEQTADSKFTILQGSCVGGTTVVNNAVSFRPHPDTLKTWKDEHGVDFGTELDASLDEVWSYMGVREQSPGALNPSGTPYFAHALSPNVSAPLDRAAIVDANIEGCLGCGYCNIGCSYGKKLSVLENALPDAQRRGDVKILSDARVERLYTETGAQPRIRTALVRLSAPEAPANDRGARFIEIEADTFVVAAGAIASPWLLKKSGIGRKLPVGRRMSFNMGAPVTAEFPDTSSFRGGFRAYEGLQISHFGVPEWSRGWVHETWWNPPVAQAVNMPGWFGRHHDNMSNYRNLMGVGVLVGTASKGRVKRARTGGADVEYRPNQRDLAKLADGLKTTAEILLEAGARRVFLNTADPDGDPMSTAAELRRIPDLCARGSSYMTLGTGHPQGGNALGTKPETSVVSPEDFRVHGYENLYLCDASVFPTSLTVNPQITVMALAHLASTKVRL